MDYSRRSIKKVLSHLKDGRISQRAAFKKLEHFPFHDMGFAKIDFHRAVRKGFPEVVFAPGKKDRDIAEIAKRNLLLGSPAELFFWRTRAQSEVDMVVKQGSVLRAFEIKWSPRR